MRNYISRLQILQFFLMGTVSKIFKYSFFEDIYFRKIKYILLSILFIKNIIFCQVTNVLSQDLSNPNQFFHKNCTVAEEMSGKDIETGIDIANIFDALDVGVEEYLSLIRYIKLFSVTIPEDINYLGVLTTKLPVPGEFYKKMLERLEGNAFKDEIMNLFPKYIKKTFDIYNDLTDCNMLGAYLKLTGTRLLIDPNDYVDLRLPACVVLKDVIDAFGDGEKYKKRMDDVYERANVVSDKLKKTRNELLIIPQLNDFNTNEEIDNSEILYAMLYNPGGWSIMDSVGKKKYVRILRAKNYYTYLTDYELGLKIREKQMRSLFDLSKSSAKNLEKLYNKINESAQEKFKTDPYWKRIWYSTTKQELTLVRYNPFRELRNVISREDIIIYSGDREKQINERKKDMLKYCENNWKISENEILN